MVPTSKCLDVGDHICAVEYTASYVRQILMGPFTIPPGPTSDMMIGAPPNSGEACRIYKGV